MNKRKLLSIIVPVYNEEGNLEWLHNEMSQELTTFHYDYEILFINDGSTDNSLKAIKSIASKNPKVRFINFSRNFGKEAATTAGLNLAKGDAAILIDADGQHPVSMFRKFIDEWTNGNHVVIGIRKSNTKEGVIKRYGSKLFNSLLNSMTGGNTVKNSTDFRLLDRAVIDEFNKLTERSRITRGLIDWLGFKRSYVTFDSPARHHGNASYSVRKLVRLAIHAFVSQSTKPLQFTGFLGALVMLFSALTTIFLLFEKYALGDPLELAITGSAILAIFLSFLIGLVLICQWLLALYVESIHNETQNRPLYIIEESN